MHQLIIFDLNGTLCDISHRRHFVERDHPNWDQFYREGDKDPPRWEVIAVARALHAFGFELWLFCGGRSAIAEKITQKWLEEHQCAGIWSRVWYRREEDGHIPGFRLKRRWYDEMSDVDRMRLMLVFEDQDRAVEMWRGLGVPCFQVVKGDP